MRFDENQAKKTIFGDSVVCHTGGIWRNKFQHKRVGDLITTWVHPLLGCSGLWAWYRDWPLGALLMLTAVSAAVGGATCKGGGGPVGFGFRPPPPPTQLWTLEPMLDVSGEASLGTRPPPEDAAAADDLISMLTMECIVNVNLKRFIMHPKNLILKPKKNKKKTSKMNFANNRLTNLWFFYTNISSF